MDMNKQEGYARNNIKIVSTLPQFRAINTSADKAIIYLKDKKIKFNNTNDFIEEESEMKKKMEIEGMMCGHCEATVKKALEEVDGVKSADVNHKKGVAVVKLSKEVSDDILKKAVEDKEYVVKSVESKLF